MVDSKLDTNLFCAILVPPIRAKIVRERLHFTAGENYNVTCQVKNICCVEKIFG